MTIHTCPTREVAAMNMWRNIAICSDARFRSLDSKVNLKAELETRNAAYRLSASWGRRIYA